MNFLRWLYRWGAKIHTDVWRLIETVDARYRRIELVDGSAREVATVDARYRRIELVDGSAREVETINASARRMELI